ncbi:LysR substrate-binding domain-containing protein [Serinicoccus chungangensis]|uniref:LysR substrate-binding domain-containing protein n=1 Tax=Serinicoccus chungangensis TaxID=767452 RepID=UPI00111A93A4|nr:LysR substrate-binding domain-containing protein [Serinicoccus chungangensis]
MRSVSGLRVGVMPATGPGALYRALARVRHHDPGCPIRVTESWGSPADLHAVREGDLDALVLVGPVSDPSLEVVRVRAVDRHVIVAADHPLAGRAVVRLDDLLDLPTFRRPEGVPPQWRSYWLNVDDRGGEPRYVGRGTTEMDALLAIGGGRVIGVAPQGWGRRAGLASLPVVDLDPAAVVLVTRRGTTEPQVRHFIDGIAASPPGLSRAERRVAALVVEGYADAEIARALSLSPRTVESQLASARRKLGLRSRAHLAAYLAGGGLP